MDVLLESCIVKGNGITFFFFVFSFLSVDFLAQAFHEHHCQRVVEILAATPYKAPVRHKARQVLQMLADERKRHNSVKIKPPLLDTDADTWQYVDQDSDDEPKAAASSLHGAMHQSSQDKTRQNKQSNMRDEQVASVGEVLSDPMSEEIGDSTSKDKCDMSGDKALMAIAESIVTSALTDATKIKQEACAGSGFDNSDNTDQNDTKDYRTVQGFETEEDSDKFSDIDTDAEVQVNIINATDEDTDSLDNTEDNCIIRNDESDDDFEIISVNDQDYVNI